MAKKNRRQVELEINRRLREGTLTDEFVEIENKNLIIEGFDFQIFYIEHGYPYFAEFAETRNISDCEILRSKPNTKVNFDKANRISVNREQTLNSQVIQENFKVFFVNFMIALLGGFAVLRGFPILTQKTKTNESPSYQSKLTIDALNSDNNKAKNAIVFVTASGDKFDQHGNLIAKAKNVVLSTSSEDNILPKAVLPGADGFPLKPHPIPRIKGAKPGIPIQGPGNIPKGPFFKTPIKVKSELSAKPKRECPVPNFDTKKEYQDFMDAMSEKGIEVECNQARFEELCVNRETGDIDEKSIFEAKGGLQGEGLNLYKDLERINDPKIRADFKAKDAKTGKHILVEMKGQIDFKSLEEQGKDISYFPSHEQVAYNIGKSIPEQKKNYVGQPNGVESTEEVLHVVNFDRIRDPQEKPALVSAVLNGAEDAGGGENIVFLNYK